jgi:hypothetical protein
MIRAQMVQVTFDMRELVFLAGASVLMILKNKKKDSGTEAADDIQKVGMSSLNKLAAAVGPIERDTDGIDAVLGAVDYAEKLINGGDDLYDNQDGVQTPLTTKVM